MFNHTIRIITNTDFYIITKRKIYEQIRLALITTNIKTTKSMKLQRCLMIHAQKSKDKFVLWNILFESKNSSQECQVN